MDIKFYIQNFLTKVLNGEIEVYNEFSLQHELGIYLRQILPNFKIQFERNVKHFRISNTVKHEMDIVIYNAVERYAVELKFPRNGQYPETMFAFIKDIAFMEQLVDNGFNATYCVALVDDKNFYSGLKKDGIYSFFRAGMPITNTIVKPTGSKDISYKINGKYNVSWTISEKLAYYIVDIIKD